MKNYSEQNYLDDCKALLHNANRQGIIEQLSTIEEELENGFKTLQKQVKLEDLLITPGAYLDSHQGFVVDVLEDKQSYDVRMKNLEVEREELKKKLENHGPKKPLINKKEHERMRLINLIAKREKENIEGKREFITRYVTVYEGHHPDLPDAIRVIEAEGPFFCSEAGCYVTRLAYVALDSIDNSINRRNKRIERVRQTLKTLNKYILKGEQYD